MSNTFKSPATKELSFGCNSNNDGKITNFEKL